VKCVIKCEWYVCIFINSIVICNGENIRYIIKIRKNPLSEKIK
jgi:hypothetical protein